MTVSSMFCDGLHRRDVLRLGVASIFGMGLTLQKLLAAALGTQSLKETASPPLRLVPRPD